MATIAWVLALSLPLADGAGEGCRAFEGVSDDIDLALEEVRETKLIPLCEQLPQADGEFALRRTITYTPDHRWVMELRTRRGRLHVRVIDTLFEPSESREFVSRLTPESFLRTLDTHRWSEIWTAPDPRCAGETVSMELGTLWEFVDASGYRARVGPIAQFCGTPYKDVVHEISELLDEVLTVPRGSVRASR